MRARYPLLVRSNGHSWDFVKLFSGPGFALLEESFYMHATAGSYICLNFQGPDAFPKFLVHLRVSASL